MNARLRLFACKEPYDLAETNALFVQAMRENCAFEAAHCEEYDAILKDFDFSPVRLQSISDLSRLPALPTVFFKRHRVFALPESQMLIRATSSGTKGQMSHIGFEAGGLLCGLLMVLRVARRRGLLSLRPAHYILLGYEPHKGNDTAVTKTAYGSTFFAPALSRTFALKYGASGYELDLDGVIAAIERRAGSRFPVRFMGFPSYTYFLLRRMEERGLRVQLPPGSKILFGGGWKQFYKEKVDKQTLYALAQRVLGVPETAIIESFGAVEHPILYLDCPHHHFHVPAYSRVIIRDPHTLRPLPYGKTGLVNLLTPMVYATPILSVMTDDLGILREGTSCPCGCKAPYLEIIGRVGLKEIKTCAAGAGELLKEGSP